LTFSEFYAATNRIFSRASANDLVRWHTVESKRPIEDVFAVLTDVRPGEL
jgi:hypothetical protein